MKTHNHPITGISTTDPAVRKVIEARHALEAAASDLTPWKIPVVGMVYTDNKEMHFYLEVHMSGASPITLHISGESRPRQLSEIISAYVPDGKEALLSNPDNYEVQFCEDPFDPREDMAFILKRGQTASWSDVTHISESSA